MLVGRWFGATADIGWLSMKISPSVGVSNPASMRSKVVLPQPEGPSSEKNSPWAMSKLTWLTAFTGPKALVTVRIEIMALAAPAIAISDDAPLLLLDAAPAD